MQIYHGITLASNVMRSYNFSPCFGKDWHDQHLRNVLNCSLTKIKYIEWKS